MPQQPITAASEPSRNPQTIINILQEIQQHGYCITVENPQNHYLFTSQILKVDYSGIILHSPCGPEQASSLTTADTLNFIASTPDTPLQFACHHIHQQFYHGQNTLQAPLPEYIQQLQRRRSPRLTLPASAQIELSDHQPEYRFQPLDISTYGIALSGDLEHLLNTGEIIPNNQLKLNRHTPSIHVGLRICNSSMVGNKPPRHLRYGAEFIQLSTQGRLQLQQGRETLNN